MQPAQSSTISRSPCPLAAGLPILCCVIEAFAGKEQQIGMAGWGRWQAANGIPASWLGYERPPVANPSAGWAIAWPYAYGQPVSTVATCAPATEPIRAAVAAGFSCRTVGTAALNADAQQTLLWYLHTTSSSYPASAAPTMTSGWLSVVSSPRKPPISSTPTPRATASSKQPGAMSRIEAAHAHISKSHALPSRQVLTMTLPEGAPDDTPRDAGTGLLFVTAPAPARGWAVKTIMKHSPADLAGVIEEGHVLVAVNATSVIGLTSLGDLGRLLMGADGTAVELTFQTGEGSHAKQYTTTLSRSNAFLGKDGGKRQRKLKTTGINGEDPSQAVDL